MNFGQRFVVWVAIAFASIGGVSGFESVEPCQAQPAAIASSQQPGQQSLQQPLFNRAQPSPLGNREFEIPAELRGRVEFWKLIFAKYGKNQLVFHHREWPEIIYSVLDFEELATQYSGAELERIKDAEIARETRRIDSALEHLGGGGAARNAFEKRLERLFQVIPEPGFSKYSDARDPKLIRTQTGIMERFRDGVMRSGRYLYAMEEIFRLEGLPMELARLPLIESSFDYTAYSSVGAAGIWQFMRSTGRQYLRISASLDERRDPIIASRAAAQYLQRAYSTLDAWPLAVTSYNHGVGGVLKAVGDVGTKDIWSIIRNYKGPAFGFASSNFFVELLAAIEIEQNAHQYFPGMSREKPWFFDEVRLQKSTNYRDIIRTKLVSGEDLERLNLAALPPIFQGRASFPAGFVLKVPEGTGRRLITSLGQGEFLSLHDSHEAFLRSLADRKQELKNAQKKGQKKVKASPKQKVEASTKKTPTKLAPTKVTPAKKKATKKK